MRIFLEKVGGEWQGACFQVWDSKPMSSPANRMVWSPDSSTIYLGGLGAVDAHPSACGNNHTIQKLTLSGKREFEILAMRSVEKGFELEFTEPYGPPAMDKNNYSFERWTHRPQWGYHSGRHVNHRGAPVQSVEKVNDPKKPNRLTLVLSQDDLRHDQNQGLIQSTVFKLNAKGVKSANGRELVTTTARYTLNNIGPDSEPVARTKQQGKNNMPLSLNSSRLHLRGTGEVRAKIRTLEGRILKEFHATGPAVLPLGHMPNGVHFLTGTLDGVPFTKKVVATN
jgi:hypothetical protein